MITCILEERILIKKEITQGSIITNIRSPQYPNLSCYGIVISARCDFAQEKIKNFYLLSALPIKQWVNEVLVDEILASEAANKQKKLLEYAEENRVDIRSFMGRDTDSFNAKLEQVDGLSKDIKNNLRVKYEAWQSAVSLSKKSPDEKKAQITTQKLINKLTPLYNGNVSNRCFIPESCYSSNSINAIASHIQEAISISSENRMVPSEVVEELRSLSVQLMKMNPKESAESDLTIGLVVDLFDIIAMSMDIKALIESGEYTSNTIPPELQHLFFVASDEEQVHIESVVTSPYIEYIMQHFSNAFVRIGVENASETQIRLFCEELVSEWKGAQT